MSNPRLFLNSIFRRGLDNNPPPRNVLVQKCLERPSQTSRIEFFEPAVAGAGETEINMKIVKDTSTVEPVSFSQSPPTAGSFNSFFFRKPQDTCFSRANLFSFPRTPRVTASSPVLFPPLPMGNTPFENNNTNGNNNSSNGRKEEESKKNTLKRTVASAGLMTAMAVYLDEVGEDEFAKQKGGSIVSASSTLEPSNFGFKKAKCAYSTLHAPLSTRSLPDFRAAARGYENANGASSTDVPLHSSSPGISSARNFSCALTQQAPRPSLPPELCQNRDWTKEFQAIMADAPRHERGERLRLLSEAFVDAATKIGRIIIRERNLPTYERSILPLSGKGVAGGEKFVQNSIFFKYAIDSHRLYGGNDEHAMKVAGHELKGGTALMSCGMMLGLNFGLMCLIDYRGYRLIATSSLPISQDTIVYGSCDGGHRVHADDEEMNEIMEKCGKILNLKGHYAGIGSNTQFLYGPCDIEGHKGHDGKLYVLDVSRIWPPEKPNASLQGSFLYKLLRAELVSRYSKALSSDAYSLFGKDNAAEHDAEVTEATMFLFQQVIPEFADLLSRMDETTLTAPRLIEELHRAGINIRHLGRVRACIPTEKTRLREIILEELICRSLKNDLRRRMRDLNSSNDMDYNNLVASFFNFVFCGLKETDTYWNIDLRSSLKCRFESCLSEEETTVDYDLRSGLDLNLIYKRLQEMAGIRFHSSSLNRSKPFVPSDIDVIYVIEKHMYATPRIEADAAAELARQKMGAEAEALLRYATEKYNSVLELKPDDNIVMLNLGNILLELAKLKTSTPKEAEQLIQQACTKLELCLRIKPDDFKAWVLWGDAISNQITTKISLNPQFEIAEIEDLYNKAQEKYKRAYQLYPSNPSTLFNWANLNYNFARLKMHNEREAAEEMLESSEKLLKQYCHQKRDSDGLINLGCLLVRMSKLKLNKQDALEEGEPDVPTNKPFSDVDRFLQEAKEKFLEAEQLNAGIACYNIACVCALQQNEAECYHWLNKSRAAGLRLDCLRDDEDFEAYRKCDWFNTLLLQSQQPLSFSPSLEAKRSPIYR
eukprot:TRINITY_DN1198_c0_g1_i1.p1 TRINITY_DN1198_c0_g1~~TRINITY_DN1198_c0_g1_i1.p1  ORF type:complete len:1050 (+),score=251.40 TRINITY_DN1198_c0_g1_i1:69-3218(+)